MINAAIKNSPGFVDKKFVEYQYIEQRYLSLASVFTGGVVSPVNQRCYFGVNKKLRGKRIVAIDVYSLEAGNLAYQDVLILGQATLVNFTFTMVNSKGEEQIKDMPVRDLLQTKGRKRIFNIDRPRIDDSYVVATTVLGAVPDNAVIAFNFYTVDW